MSISTAAPKHWIFQAVISWMKTVLESTKSAQGLLGTLRNEPSLEYVLSEILPEVQQITNILLRHFLFCFPALECKNLFKKEKQKPQSCDHGVEIGPLCG